MHNKQPFKPIMSDGKYLPLYDTGIILREKSFQAIARMQWNTYDD